MTPLEKDMVPIGSVGMEEDENVQLLANGAKSRRPSPPKSSERFQDFRSKVSIKTNYEHN